MRTVLVLGAYGLIGAACARALAADGCRVVAFGRSADTLARVLPDLPHVVGDLRRTSVGYWSDVLSGVDVVVNAAGALQDGGQDDLRAVHVTAIRHLAAALGPRRLVQISAVGVREGADTAFMRTKAEGDAAVRDLASDWVILRPGLVIGAAGYGGTALLRAAAALPVIPGVLAGSTVQCVALDEVAAAVVRAVRGEVSARSKADLVEPEGRPLPQVIAAFRR